VSVLLFGRGGMGDAIYARPFVREAVRRFGDVYVETSWPELFADLPVRCVKRMGGLAVQAYHGELAPADLWHEPPPTCRRIRLRYRWDRLAHRTVVAEMEVLSKLAPRLLRFDLPPLPESPVAGRYAVVRPPAIRLDFPAPAREPLPEYLASAAAMLRSDGYRVVTLGAFVPGLEEPNGEVPADVRFEHGELPLLRALALVANAALVVCGPCWMVPAAAVAPVPLVMICGGCGGRNKPQALLDKRMLRAPATWLQPAKYCMCRKRDHDCPKEITNFAERFGAAARLTARAA
jgi:hypothetical protein